MNKRNKVISVLFIIILTVYSCSNLVEEDGNINPNGLINSDGNSVLTQANLVVVKLSESAPSRYSAIITDQMTGTGRCAGMDRYIFNPSEFDNDWNHVYTEGIKNTRWVRELAQKEN